MCEVKISLILEITAMRVLHASVLTYRLVTMLKYNIVCVYHITNLRNR
jgi:hypothetical protein